MDDRYKTLGIIYDIVKGDPQPGTYKCRPREIILKHSYSWTVIEKHLKLLEKEGMVVMRQEDTVVIFITEGGMEKVRS